MPHQPTVAGESNSTRQNDLVTSQHGADPSTKRKTTGTTFHLLAGLASGFTSSILLQPVDLLKTRVQQSASHSLTSTVRSIIAGPRPIQQLWRGTLPSVIRTSCGSALYFTTLNSMRSHLASTRNLLPTGLTQPATPLASSSALPQLSLWANLFSGALARASVGFVMMPVTVIKVRYESNFYNYGSLLRAGQHIAATEGMRGFFAGFGATAIRDAPYAGLYVVFYEKGKALLSEFMVGSTSNLDRSDSLDNIATSETGTVGALIHSNESVSLASSHPRLSPGMSAGINFASSALAASMATVVTNPPDAIKTRLQLRPQKYHNTLQALRVMLREEGTRSLLDGLGLRMARKAMSSALAWTVYEEVVRRAEATFAT